MLVNCRSFLDLMDTLRTGSIAKRPSEIVYDAIMETGYWGMLLVSHKTLRLLSDQGRLNIC